MKKAINQIIAILTIALIVLMSIYVCYWVAKTCSYNFWYKGMVRNTIVEMVKQEALRG